MKPSSKAEEAYSIIKGKIVNLEIKPLADLSEDDLIRELGLSRTPIREAIQRLAREGFIRIYPRKGTIVSDITLDLINSIYEARLLNEPYLAKIACNHVTDEWIERLRTEFLKINGSDNKSISEADKEKYIKLDRELHGELTRYTNNPFLKEMFMTVNSHNQRIRIQTSRRNTDYARSIKEHVNILNALAERDEQKVEDAVRDHIKTARREAFDYYYYY